MPPFSKQILRTLVPPALDACKPEGSSVCDWPPWLCCSDGAGNVKSLSSAVCFGQAIGDNRSTFISYTATAVPGDERPIVDPLDSLDREFPAQSKANSRHQNLRSRGAATPSRLHRRLQLTRRARRARHPWDV